MTRAEAIKILEENKPTVIFDDYDTQKRMADIWNALDMAISDMTAISKIRAKLNTVYNNTSEDAQLGLSIALDIFDRYTKGERSDT